MVAAAVAAAGALRHVSERGSPWDKSRGWGGVKMAAAVVGSRWCGVGGGFTHDHNGCQGKKGPCGVQSQPATASCTNTSVTYCYSATLLLST